jgi:biopolymer transport protein ExbB
VRRSSASLGTVIGVMITFAAIAASGDVNVNTIARDSGGARLYRGRAGRRDPTVFAYNILMAASASS